MTDVFNDIMKQYKIALTGLSVPFYAVAMPQDAPDTYVIYQPVYTTANESKTCSGQDATIQVSIISLNQYGTFSLINTIADEIFSRIYPQPNSKLSAINNIFTKVAQDRFITLPLYPNVQVQRVIHFSHNF